MKNLKTIDFERVALLLEIQQKASGASLDALAREAAAELRELNADARENVSARAAKPVDKGPMVA